MTPRYVFMVAVLLGPFGCDSDPGRGPKPQTRAIALAAPASAAATAVAPQHRDRGGREDPVTGAWRVGVSRAA